MEKKSWRSLQLIFAAFIQRCKRLLLYKINFSERVANVTLYTLVRRITQ